MEEAIPDGAYVMCKILEEDDAIEIGDIYGYLLPTRAVILHRAVEEAGPDTYIFKGDKNPNPDAQAVPSSAIHYKYLFIVYN